MKMRQNKNPEWQTSPGERLSYYVYFLGQNTIYALVSTFLTTYLLFQGIDPTKSATVMLIVKIWDAVNDAMFGAIFDAVKFKSKKKFIPWLKISTILIPITTVAIFVIPNGSSEVVKLAWFAIAYVLWDAAYTLCDVPIYGIVTAMTSRIDERTSLQSYRSIYDGIGYGITYIICTVLVSEKVGLTFGIAALIIAVIALATMSPVCFKAKERVHSVDEEQFTLKRMFKYLFGNKYLLIFYGGYFFFSAFAVNNSLNQYVSYYLFDDSMFSLVIGAFSAVPSLVVALIVPQLIKKFDKMKLFRFSALITAVLGIITWAIGYDSKMVYLILSGIRSFFAALGLVELFMFTPDCAEYGKYKTGIEAKGITFAIQTFMVKLTAAVSSAMGLFILGIDSVGWKSVTADSFEALQKSGVSQTPHALNVLWFTFALLPFIGYLLSYIVWKFYRLTDKDVQVMADCNSGAITREEAEERIKTKL